MDLSCIILSGDLELYVLGMLPEEDAYKIQQLSLLFPEVDAEINRIRETLEDFALSDTIVEPSPSVKENLMRTLSGLKSSDQDNIAEKNFPEQNITTPAPVIQMQRARNNNNRFLIAASLIGFIICIGFILYLVAQNKTYQNSVATLRMQMDTLHQFNQQQQTQLQTYAQTMNILRDENYRKINMTNVPGKPQALAQVFWNTKTKEVFVADISLPAHPPGKQYQFWAIVNGKPVDGGMLNDSKDAMQKMKEFKGTADAFAITLEKAGGSPTPTMQAMYVMAKVS